MKVFIIYVFWLVICFIYNRALLAKMPFTDGRGTLRMRSAFSISRVEAIMAITVWIDGTSFPYIPFHCLPRHLLPLFLHPFSWKLRHNTQKVPATLPSVSHARLDSFVAACRWATARDRDRDRKRQGRKETVSWSGTLILL